MKIAKCPNCGANVEFSSAAAAVSVCGYCKTCVLREGDDVKNIGSLSAIVGDVSPIAVGASGLWNGKGFRVIGRLRMSYDAGSWNEWFLEFSDGTPGWLSDAFGSYAITLGTPGSGKIPPFEVFSVGKKIRWQGSRYVVSDARMVRCVGGEGEIGIMASDGVEYASVDLREEAGTGFASVDWSDGEGRAYEGSSVGLLGLKMQGLRDVREIEEASQRLAGSRSAMECPGCGSSIAPKSGATQSAACSSCGLVCDVSREHAVAIYAQEDFNSFARLIPLGAKGVLRGVGWEALGWVRRSDGEGESWDEWLLWSLKTGAYIWLVGGGRGEFYLSETLTAIPKEEDGKAFLDGKRFTRKSEYTAEAVAVFGEFNWRMRKGEKVSVVEYDALGGAAGLSREEYENEVAWSKFTRLPPGTVEKAFGLSVPFPAKKEDDSFDVPWLWIGSAWGAVFLLDMIARLTVPGGGSFLGLMIASWALWLPRKLLTWKLFARGEN